MPVDASITGGYIPQQSALEVNLRWTGLSVTS
jgi:hypothetical protein